MSVLQHIVRHIMGTHRELGFSRLEQSQEYNKRWVTELRKRSVLVKRQIAEGTIRKIIAGDPGDVGHVGDVVLSRLADIFRKKPVPKRDAHGHVIKDEWDFENYGPFKDLTSLQFKSLGSLEEFKKWEASHLSQRLDLGGERPKELDRLTGADLTLLRDSAAPASNRICRTYKFEAETHPGTPVARFDITVPTTRNLLKLTRDHDRLHYVTWRYALEPGPMEPNIAREVMTLERVNEAYHAILTYKLGDGKNEPVRLFEGPVFSLGQSNMCVLLAVEETSDEWMEDLRRGRVLFLRRRTGHGNHLVRFGLMATTRARGDCEPCAACMIMALVERPIGDIQDFRRRVTLIGPAEEVIKRDFGGLPDRDQQLIWTFLQNVPEGYRDSTDDSAQHPLGQDRVLRLLLERYEQNMVRIRRFIIEKRLKNPIIADWKSDGVLLAGEEDAPKAHERQSVKPAH